jgi:hypothetical protein
MYSLSVEFHISSTCTSFLAAYCTFPLDDFPCRTLCTFSPRDISPERQMQIQIQPHGFRSPRAVSRPGQQKHKHLQLFACCINLRLPSPQWLRTIPKNLLSFISSLSVQQWCISSLDSFSLSSLVRGKLPGPTFPEWRQ